MKSTIKATFASFAIAVLAGCASQSTTESSPAAAPAPSASNMGSAATREAPSTTVAGTPTRTYPMPQARSVYYEYDKAEIKPEGVKTIEAHAQYLRVHPEIKVKVEGNADERGSREYNLALGQRRADAVMKRMTILGVPGDRIETVSYGKEKPKAIGHDESAWSENRRSDILYR
jgi:peptidoglycan-associated lipoprotein